MQETMEYWQPIPGYEGWYEVSNLGRIRRARHGMNTYVGKILHPSPDCDGYLVVHLSRFGVVNSYRVNRIVAKVFIPNPNALPEANHINGIKIDNSVSNLEWTTTLANIQHAESTGLRAKGERHPSAKLTVAEVLEIRNKYVRKGRRGNAQILATEYGVTKNAIINIINGRTWKNATLVHTGA